MSKKPDAGPAAPKGMRPSHVYLSKEHRALLNERRYRTGETFSQTIRDALDLFFQAEKKKGKR